ncbi:MAG: hypothetical protein IZT56_14435, partial [Bacteroidetes bacterium]|nr:hypothetical protein [Bacteroidota bacterium]
KNNFFKITITITITVVFVVFFNVGFGVFANVKEPCLTLKNNLEHDFSQARLNKKNEDVLVKILLLTKWIDLDHIYEMNHSQLRNTLLLNLAQKTSIKKEELKIFSDLDLTTIALMYRFLENSKIKPTEELKLMTLDGLKNTLLNANKENTHFSISTLKKFSNYKNFRTAYNWWLPKNYETLIKNLNEVEAVKAHYKLGDNYNHSTDVLKIERIDEKDYKYIGVYHKMVGNNHFELSLAGSNNLKSWTFIVTLGDRAHQGELTKWGDGFLLVNEEDKTEGSNNIEIRYYTSYKNLKMNIAYKSLSLPRKFSEFAEGTPDIRKIVGETPSDSYIQIGFHYFNNGDVDYQAMGILKNFKQWKAWKDDITNYNILEKGFKGNIGGRTSFKYLNDQLIILEAQIDKNDFSKWRLLIGDGAFYTQLNLKTSYGSTSFANPGITQIDKSTYAITSYLHSKGNSYKEKGQLIYLTKLND